MTSLEWLEEFSNALTRIMQESDITQSELADKSGLDQSTISRYIRGEQIPNAIAIVNISYALDCDLSELIDFYEQVDI